MYIFFNMDILLIIALICLKICMCIAEICMEACLKILIWGLVFVLCYVEDGILKRNTKNHKSYPFFGIK